MAKKVTIRDIARLGGVSVTTVSQILNGKGDRFSKKTRDKVLKLRDEYGYVPDFNARNLIMKKTSSTIGILVPNISTPFFGTFVEGVQQVAQQEEMVPLVFSANRDPHREQAYLSQMLAHYIDGLIIASATMTTDTINKLIGARKVPYILFDQNYAQHGARVQTDDYHGGQLAAQHLLSLGHRHIAMIEPKEPSENFTQRLAGFKDTLAQHGVELKNVIKAHLGNRGGYEATTAVITSGASAVFTGNDDMAIGLLKGLREHQVMVPDQISVIGYDDIYLDEYVYPQLTTIRQPILELGNVAAKMVLNRIRDDQSQQQIQRFPVKLVVRETTAPFQQK